MIIRSCIATFRFAAQGAYKNELNDNGAVGYLYTVKVKEGRDVNVEIGHDHSFKYEHEVVTTVDGIPPEDVMGVQRVDEFGDPIGDFEKNPNFKKP